MASVSMDIREEMKKLIDIDKETFRKLVVEFVKIMLSSSSSKEAVRFQSVQLAETNGRLGISYTGNNGKTRFLDIYNLIEWNREGDKMIIETMPRSESTLLLITLAEGGDNGYNGMGQRGKCSNFRHVNVDLVVETVTCAQLNNINSLESTAPKKRSSGKSGSVSQVDGISDDEEGESSSSEMDNLDVESRRNTSLHVKKSRKTKYVVGIAVMCLALVAALLVIGITFKMVMKRNEVVGVYCSQDSGVDMAPETPIKQVGWSTGSGIPIENILGKEVVMHSEKLPNGLKKYKFPNQ